MVRTRHQGMNKLERDSKQYDVLVMETSTQEKTARDGDWCVPVKHVAKLGRMIVSTERLVKSWQPSGSLTQEIDKGVLFGCESSNVRTVRLVNSCVPVSVELVDKDEDADENVEADRTRTGETC